MEAKLALVGGVIPGVIAGVALLFAWIRHARRSSASEAPSPRPVWILPIVILIAYVLGDYTKNGWPPDLASAIWPDSNNYRYVHAVALACVLGLVEALVALPVLVAVIARAIVFGAAYWMLVEGIYAAGTIPADEFYGWMGVVALGGAGVATAFDKAAPALPGWRAPALLVIVFAGAGGVTLAGRLSYGLHGATPLIAVMSAAVVVGLIAKQLRLDRGGATAATGVLIALVIGTGFQTDPLSPPSLVLLACAPIAALGALAFRTRRTAGFIAALVGIGVVLGMSGATAWLAQPQPDPDDPYADYLG